MSTGIFKRARIFIPICLFLVLAIVFSFLMMPGISSGGDHDIVTLPATDIGISSATLNGNFFCVLGILSGNLVFADPIGEVGFVWGTNRGGPYPNVIGPTYAWNCDYSFSTILNNLSPFTTYYYRAYRTLYSALPNQHAVFADGAGWLYANEVNFTTLGQNISASTVASGDAGTTIGTPADVNFNFINVQPTVASAGQPVTVVANVVNRGSLEGGYTANLQINGHIEQTTMGTVAGNTYIPVEFTVVKDTPGTYSIDIGGQTATFTVVAAETSGSSSISQSQIIIIALVILGIAAVGLFIAVIMRRRSGY